EAAGFDMSTDEGIAAFQAMFNAGQMGDLDDEDFDDDFIPPDVSSAAAGATRQEKDKKKQARKAQRKSRKRNRNSWRRGGAMSTAPTSRGEDPDLQRALDTLASDDPRWRVRGAKALGAFGCRLDMMDEDPDVPAVLDALIRALDEPEPKVLYWVLK